MISRAADALGALTALSGTKSKVAAQLALACGYAVFYAILREASNDQWYFPAGLRVAALLLAPYRYWAALFLGDVAALAATRVPYIGTYGLSWYFGALLPVWPPVAFIVHRLRRMTAAPAINRALDAASIAIAGLLCAEIVTLVNKACSALWRKDVSGFHVGDLIIYSMGDIQAILLASVAVALIKGWAAWKCRWVPFLAECGGAAIVTAALSMTIVIGHLTEETKLEAARLLLLAPAIILALRHGWRGAAIGALASNLGLAATIPHLEAGQSDSAGLLMQEVFVFASYALLVLGTKIRDRSTAQESRIAVMEFRRNAKAGFTALEAQMRDKALRAEAMQDASRGSIEPAVAVLRKAGQSEVAMGLIGSTQWHSSEFRRSVIDEIYPLSLERKGLFATLGADAFREKFSGTECIFDMTGNPRCISIETQLSSYRIVCESLDYFLPSEPHHVHVRIRCTTRAGLGHVSIALWAREPRVEGRSSADTARLARLRTRAEAYDGSFHSRANRIRVILTDGPETTEATLGILEPANLEINGKSRST